MDGLRLWDLYAAAALVGLTELDHTLSHRAKSGSHSTDLASLAAKTATKLLAARTALMDDACNDDEALGPLVATERKDDRGLPRCGSPLGARACWLAVGHEGDHTDGFVPWRTADSFTAGERA